MKIAAYLRGVASIVLTDVASVFTKAKEAVNVAPLPANLKTDLGQVIDDAQADVTALAGLAGTQLGNLIADGVDDATTFFANLEENILAGQKPTAASSSALQLTVKAAIAQIQTLAAQSIAGASAIGAAPKPTVQPTPQPAPQQ